jgi:hypothetical protein
MSKDLQALANRFVTITGATEESALSAAKLCAWAFYYSKVVEAALRRSRAIYPDGATKAVIRELGRLTRSHPREAALDIGGQAEDYLNRAMVARGELGLYEAFAQRSSVSTKVERIKLIKAVSYAAEDAIELVRSGAKGAGRPVSHHLHTLIAKWAECFHAFLDVRQTHNKRSHCRLLLAECAEFFGVPKEELVNPFTESKTIRKALSERPMYSGFSIARKVNLPN